MGKLQFIFFTLVCTLTVLGVHAQTTTGERLRPDINVEFKFPASATAGTKLLDKESLGGFGPSENFPSSVALDGPGRAGQVSLVALPVKEKVFWKRYRGMTTLLINRTSEGKWFSAVDSRLYLVLEALDTDKRWKPVEEMPTSWCGNSYHRVYLGPSEQWEFVQPLYHGSFKTKLRFRLGSDKDIVLYSNEFDGSINKGQFINPTPDNFYELFSPHNSNP